MFFNLLFFFINRCIRGGVGALNVFTLEDLLSYKTLNIKKLTIKQGIFKFHSNATKKKKRTIFKIFIFYFYGMTLYTPNALGWDSGCV